MSLSKDQILNVSDHETRVLDVPEWGGEVILRSLTGTERDTYEASLFQGEGAARKMNLVNVRARLVALCVVDENGDRVFQDHEAADLGRKRGTVLDRLFDECQAMNGLGTKAVEEAEEN